MISRSITLLLGSTYLCAVAGIFSLATQKPVWITLPMVAFSASIIMVCLGYFAVRTANRKESMRQFDLSAFLLLMVPLAIYLAALQRLYQEVPRDNVTPAGYVIIGSGAVIFVAFSSMVLMWMAEALMWIAASLVHLKRGR